MATPTSTVAERMVITLTRLKALDKVAEQLSTLGLDVHDAFTGHNRRPRYVRARRTVFEALRAHGLSYPEIANLAEMDHSTIVHAIGPRAKRLQAKQHVDGVSEAEVAAAVAVFECSKTVVSRDTIRDALVAAREARQP